MGDLLDISYHMSIGESNTRGGMGIGSGHLLFTPFVPKE